MLCLRDAKGKSICVALALSYHKKTINKDLRLVLGTFTRFKYAVNTGQQ